MLFLSIGSIKEIKFDFKKFHLDSVGKIYQSEGNIGFLKRIGCNVQFGYIPYLIKPLPPLHQSVIKILKSEGIYRSGKKLPVEIMFWGHTIRMNLSIRIFYPSILVIQYDFFSSEEISFDEISDRELRGVTDKISTLIKLSLETSEIPSDILKIDYFKNFSYTFFDSGDTDGREFFSHRSHDYIAYLTKHTKISTNIKETLIEKNDNINHDCDYFIVNTQGVIGFIPELLSKKKKCPNCRINKIVMTHLYGSVIDYLLRNYRATDLDVSFFLICLYNIKKVISKPKAFFNNSVSHSNLWNNLINDLYLKDVFEEVDPQMRDLLEEKDQIFYRLASKIYGNEKSYQQIKSAFKGELAKEKIGDLFSEGAFNLALEVIKKHTIG